MEMAQLWVNLPAKDKMSRPHYQPILAADIPNVELPDAAGRVRVIAGSYGGHAGRRRRSPRSTSGTCASPPARPPTLSLPDGHTALIALLRGTLKVNGTHEAEAAQVVAVRSRRRRRAARSAARTRRSSC